jgi:hypothetical protein
MKYLISRHNDFCALFPFNKKAAKNINRSFKQRFSRIMYEEDKVKAGVDKGREFGVLAEVLRTLQREELEQTDTCIMEISEASTPQSMIDTMTEINATLKEIAETQRSILGEIKKNRAE